MGNCMIMKFIKHWLCRKECEKLAEATACWQVTINGAKLSQQASYIRTAFKTFMEETIHTSTIYRWVELLDVQLHQRTGTLMDFGIRDVRMLLAT